MKYQYILFDLDGTLTDPVVGITKSVQYALNYFGIKEDNLDHLRCFIGPPLRDAFMEYYHFSEEQAEQAVQKFREYFIPSGIYENEVYPGIRDMLETLEDMGRTLIVATSKPIEFADKVLEHFKLRKYFSFIAGSTLQEGRTKKNEVLAYCLDECRLVDMSDLVMVGDRKYDILGAKEFGIQTIGVLYGHGTREELEEAGADIIVKNVRELTDVLLENEEDD